MKKTKILHKSCLNGILSDRSDELLTLWTSTVFTTKLHFYTFKNILHNLGRLSSPESSTCCHRASARLGTPVLSESPNTSVSTLEAQMESFQPQVTSTHTNFTQQEPGMLSSHLETSWQGSRSKQLLVRCFSRKQWLLSFSFSDLMTGLFLPDRKVFEQWESSDTRERQKIKQPADLKGEAL